VKQQFTGSYTLDVASRTIVLSGIEIPPERLTVIINSTVGFVYHNIEHEPVAQVSIAPSSTGGLLSAVNYDAIGGFDGDYTLYQDGLDKGGVINIVGGVITGVVNPGDGYSAGFANTVGGTRFVVTIDPSYNNTVIVFPAYKDCEAHQNSDSLSIFYDDGIDLGQLIKDESDETQGILSDIHSELEEANATLTAFKAEAKSESDETQGLLSDIEAEIADANTTLAAFKTEAKSESDELQILLGEKLVALVEGLWPTEFLSLFEAANDVDVDFVPGGYGPSRIIFSRSGVFLKGVNLYYGTSGDSLGKIVLITSGLWSPLDLPSAQRTIWLDASDPATVSQSSGVVDSWGDKWAGGFEFNTTTNSEKPTTGVAQINGLETITFDGANDVLYSRKNGALRSLTDLDKDVAYNNWAGFFVVRSKSLKNASWYNEVGVSNYIGIGPYSNNWFYFDAGLDTSGATNRTAYTPFTGTYPTTSLVGLTANTTDSTKSYLNGEMKHQTSSPFSLSAGVWTRLGGNGTPTGGSDADWGEVIILRQVPDEPTRQKIEGYLAHKWGLTGSLAASHPYKFAPPGI
jgi:hypothetical protein